MGAIRSQIAALRPGQTATGGSTGPHPEYHAELQENKAPYGRRSTRSAPRAGGGSLMTGLAGFARRPGVRC